MPPDALRLRICSTPASRPLPHGDFPRVRALLHRHGGAGRGERVFSCAEAALFSLQPDDRRALRYGNAAQRVAIDLLRRPDRLLTAILFWNLTVNYGYFLVAAQVELQVHLQGHEGEALALTVGSLLAMIAFGEMLPKTFGVLQARRLASVVGLPIAALVRVLDPLMPVFVAANNLLQRVLLPGFKREPYLEISDLERAIELSTADAQLAAKEQSALRNIVLLSELSAEELMRPRNQFPSFTPPVSLEDLHGELPAGRIPAGDGAGQRRNCSGDRAQAADNARRGSGWSDSRGRWCTCRGRRRWPRCWRSSSGKIAR